MSISEFEKFKELALKGRLDEEGKKRLKAFCESNPSCSIPDLEQEILLGRLLHEIPQVDVSSNFTERVLAEIDKIEPEPVTGHGIAALRDLLLFRPIYKIGALAVIIILTGFCYFSYTESRNARLASKLIELTNAPLLEDKESLIAVEILKDFDVIQKINNQRVFVDTELLAALKAN